VFAFGEFLIRDELISIWINSY